MTLEEARQEKKVAEEAIREILQTLQRRTGISPFSVSVRFVDCSTFSSVRRELAIGEVQIEMESL
ncbi:hypothetical protein [Variovorax sp. PAMC 28711]|uniref:hypothetical protein n=1 Tax=Variovorax sp. PAMC 28711 TaxID=1795631 RepID=UPI00078EAF6E|nr:hypothetical protein [Variovorax sp. PAMC 28711]AMM23180.1 hypothetical protein AX767_01415 [Variovorax sp. PAMC 28711]